MEEYKISLGAEISQQGLSNVKDQIKTLESIPIKLTLDKNLSNEIKAIKEQIDSLGSSKGKNKNALAINTDSVEKSLNDVHSTINEIKTALGTIDSKSGMKSLLSYINQISNALEKASGQFGELNAELKKLSSKDFGINIDLKFGSGKNPVAANAAYGQKVRNETLPQLKQQYQQIAEYIKKVKGLKSDWESTALSLALRSGGANAYDLLGNMGSNASLSKQMDSYKQMITYMKKAASMDGIDLSSVTAGFSKSADELISDAKRVQSGIEQTEKQAEETKQQLKGLFGGGIDSDALNAQLDSIVNNLNEIKSALQSLSANNTIDGLTQSFNGLSQTLEKLIKNAGTFKQAMNAGVSGVSGSANIGSNVAKEVKNVSNALKTAGNQDGKVYADSLKNSVESNLNLDEIIAREAHTISSFLEFDKYLEPDKAESAIKEISAAISDYVTNVKVAIGNTEELGDDIAYLARSNGINKIKDAILKSRGGESSTKDIDQSYLDVYDYVKNYNKQGYKVNIPESIRQREDYNSMRRKLGAAFTSGHGTDLETFIQQLNEEKGEIIDLSKGIDSAFDQLYDAVQRGKSLVKSGKYSSGINIIDDIPKNELSDVYALIEAALNNIEEFQQKAKEAANIVRNMDVSAGEGGFKEISADVDTLEGNLISLKSALQSVGFDGASIDSLTKDFDELGISVKNVTSKLDKNDSLTITVKGINEAKEAVTVIGKLNKEDKTIDFDIKVDDDFKKLESAAEKVREKLKFHDFEGLNLSGFDSEIREVISRFDKLSNTSDNLKRDIESLNVAFDSIKALDNANDIERLVNANTEYEDILKRVKAQLDINEQAQKEAAAAQKEAINLEKLQQSKLNLSLKMENWLRDNSRAADEFGDRIKMLQVELKSCDNVRFSGIKKEFEEIKQTAQLAGKTGMTMFDKIKNQFSKYGAYFGVAELFMYVEQGLRDMFEQVKLIDSAMTELRKVTDETDETYNRFLSNAADRAKVIGTTIDGLVDSTAEFAKIGYSFEDSQGLAEVANIYKLVGDNIESAEVATQSLISTMAAFKNEMNGMSNEDFAMSIVDKFNEVSNKYSIGSGGLGEALTRSASSMAAANNTLDETIALITAANEVVQNPEKIGRLLPI